MQNAAVQSGNGDGNDARFGANGNHIQLVRREELRPPLEHLLNREVRAASKFQERSIGRKGAVEKFRLKLELLQCALAQILNLLEPFRIRGAVLRAALIICEQLADFGISP